MRRGAYRDRLPGQAPGAVRDSVSAGVAVTGKLGDAALLDSVRSAFPHGMDVSLIVAGSLPVFPHQRAAIGRQDWILVRVGNGAA